MASSSALFRASVFAQRESWRISSSNFGNSLTSQSSFSIKTAGRCQGTQVPRSDRSRRPAGLVRKRCPMRRSSLPHFRGAQFCRSQRRPAGAVKPVQLAQTIRFGYFLPWLAPSVSPIPVGAIRCNRPRLFPSSRAVFLRLSSLGAEGYSRMCPLSA